MKTNQHFIMGEVSGVSFGIYKENYTSWFGGSIKINVPWNGTWCKTKKEAVANCNEDIQFSINWKNKTGKSSQLLEYKMED